MTEYEKNFLLYSFFFWGGWGKVRTSLENKFPSYSGIFPISWYPTCLIWTKDPSEFWKMEKEKDFSVSKVDFLIQGNGFSCILQGNYIVPLQYSGSMFGPPLFSLIFCEMPSTVKKNFRMSKCGKGKYHSTSKIIFFCSHYHSIRNQRVLIRLIK